MKQPERSRQPDAPARVGCSAWLGIVFGWWKRNGNMEFDALNALVGNGGVNLASTEVHPKNLQLCGNLALNLRAHDNGKLELNHDDDPIAATVNHVLASHVALVVTLVRAWRNDNARLLVAGENSSANLPQCL